MTLREGFTLDNGKYILGAVLGKGGFGITYLAYQPGLQARVAIKEYFPSDFVTRGGSDGRTFVVSHSPYYEQFLEKFKKEAVILERFSSVRNIVQVKNLLEENNTAYIVMEYVEGTSLKQMIRDSGGKIAWEKLRDLLDPMLESLQQIHDGGLIHRDIAPDNILIDKNDRPVLIDFGTARFSSDSGGSVPVGKDGYTPVEQMTGADSQDPRTDVYALGATYYKALTGKTPQNAKSRFGADSLVPVSELEPSVPRNVSDAVMKALSPDIDGRWNSVAEFRKALNAIPSPPVPPRINLLPLLIAAAVLVLGFLLFFILRPNYPEHIREYMAQAENGSASAQVALGDAWYTGSGVKQDPAKGCEWYRKAADQGYAGGEYALAKCYFEGTGAAKSNSEYFRWLERAAGHGLAAAQYDLGRYFETGLDGNPNQARAEYWYQQAQKNGYVLPDDTGMDTRNK